MSRSRRRKLARLASRPRSKAVLMGLPIATLLAGPVIAQDQDTEGLEEIIVSAQKRDESLQNVPLSITALGNQKLDDLRLTDFADFATFLPSVSFTTGGPGFSRVYFRGVAAGDNGNHSGSQPSVGIYLDEQPITTIQGAIDLHLYDIARVEALAGPQNTLYGASSQAGTIRYITNKPKIGQFEAGYEIEGSMLDGGGGGIAEGFINAPLRENAAVRLVGWYKKEPGYIENVSSTRIFPTASENAGTTISVSNTGLARSDYNSTQTYGARVALKIDLNDRWTLTPTFMGQDQTTKGGFAFDPALGDLKVARYNPESSRDRFGQISLTVQGKLSNFDLVYSGAFLKRDADTRSDYSDYSYFYDVLYGYQMYNDAGDIINPSQFIQGKDRYKRWSHELRIASNGDGPLKYVAGIFAQQQQHGIEQRYLISDMTAAYEVSGWDDTLWLTEQLRTDRDYAAFGELSYSFNDKLTGTVGARWFKAKNSLDGFYGFGEGYSGSGNSGETRCSIFGTPPRPRFDRSNWVPFTAVGTAPCNNLNDKTINETGVSPKINLTYRVNDDKMIYFTGSEGFRPGGVNRRGTFPPYKADFLRNYELGWKTSWADKRVRFNGALFFQKWSDFQFSFLGQNGLTNIVNGGDADIKGIEADLNWAATDKLLLSGSMTVLDSKLTKDFCKRVDANGVPLAPALCPGDQFAPKGTELPLAAKFKANVTARYSFDVNDWKAHWQATYAYEGERRSALVPSTETNLGGPNAAYGVGSLSFGMENDTLSYEFFIDNLTDERAEINRFAQCDEAICTQPYIITNRPRVFGIKFSQKF